jgi:hypothetical protein
MDTLKNRKQFKFYRSYFDIISELENDNDKLNYLLSILEFQFNGIELPLKGMAKFAFKSQKHSLERQLKGFIDATSNETPLETPLETTLRGADSIPIEQTPLGIINNKEVIIKDKKESEIIKDCKNNVFTESLNDFNKWIELWERWKKYKYEQHKDKYKSQDSENTAAKKLLQYSNNDYSIGLHIVEKSIANGYKGFFEIKKHEIELIKPTEYIKKPFVSNNPYFALCDSQPSLSDRLKKQQNEPEY